MKDKIIEILNNQLLSRRSVTDIENIADEILKIAEFESLCNPDIYEASANEHFELEYKEQNQVIEILKGHVDGLQKQLAQRDEIIKVSFDRIEELRKQINKLKAEIK